MPYIFIKYKINFPELIFCIFEIYYTYVFYDRLIYE